MLYFIFTACEMLSKRQLCKSNSSTPEKPPQKSKKAIGSSKHAPVKSRKVLFLGSSGQNH